MHSATTSALASIGLAGVLALAAGGCTNPAESPPQAGSPAPAPVKAPDPVLQLRPGMSRAQVEAVMGKPAEVKKVSSNDGEVVVLIYRRPLESRVEGIAPTMVDVPWFDPITGELRMQKVPAPTEQRTESVEELSIYVINGLLADVRRAVQQTRQFSP